MKRMREIIKLKISTASMRERFFFTHGKLEGRTGVKLCEKPLRRSNSNFRTCGGEKKIVPSSKIAKCAIPVATKKSQWIHGLLGSFVSLVKHDRAMRLHEYVDENHKTLGPIFRDRIGSVDLIFLNSPEDYRKIFRLEGSTPMHFLPEAWHSYNKLRDRPRGLLFMDGEEWLHFRKIMNKIMLLPNPRYFVAPRCYEAANDLVKEWRVFSEPPSIVCELEDRLYRWSIEVMLATLVGSAWKIYKPRVDHETTKLANILHRVFALSAKLSLVPVKYAIKFRLPVWREFCRIADEVFHSVNLIVSEILRIESNDGLLSLIVKEGITCKKDLVRIITDLIIAAGDTTAFSTQWSLFMLAKYPQVQEKMYERIKCLEGENELMGDIYVKAIIKESLRLYPTAPFLTRFLPDDANIAGHLVRKGELIIMSIYSSGRDPKNFSEPNVFRPERWIRNDAGNYEEVKNPYGSLPFALGARSCVGRKLAETQMILTLSQIIKNYRIECFNADSIKMTLHLISVPSEPIKLKLYKRLSTM